MPLPDSFVTVVFDGEPSVLVRPEVFRCYECGGVGCQRCDDRGHVRCSHPALLLTGPSVPFTDGEEWVYTARCAGCGSDVRDIREHAGDRSTDVFHAGEDARSNVTPPSQSTRDVWRD